jgi:hypothetical protein
MVVLPAPLVVSQASPAAAATPCDPPVVSVIACENSKTGTPESDWGIVGSGSSTIQGFATSMSVQPGETVRFKIKSAAAYRFDILRLGYYQGNGARKVAAGLTPTAAQPQSQPTCVSVPDSTGLIDCGNWAVSASWTVPTTAVSGVYLAHLVRNDNGAESHIVFIVRDDSSRSDMLFQTSDETWQAYNSYGGNSLYACATNCPAGSPAAYKGASKVSYNRPFNSAVDDQGRSWLMYSEYPMIRFLEANGYDVSYTSGLDMSAAGASAIIKQHKAFMSVGHDEYWTGTQRTNVEAARDDGVNLAFFSGNEVFWKTRLEPSADGTATANRTLVCYKDTHYDSATDPEAWTGTWQDPRFSPPGDGGKPQNALTGQLFLVNSGTTDIKVPSAYSKLRFWRNTAVAGLGNGQTLTLGAGLGTLGYEWDADSDNGFRPAGAFRLSATTSTTAETFTDYGSTVRSNSTATHNMTLYRAASGALVFGAGTVQWPFGLDSAAGGTPDRNMQQATVNLFADMGAQPYALIAGLTVASASSDVTAPASVITAPASGSTVGDGTRLTISGTATDTGGVVAGVEVSTDAGVSWHPATGTSSWTYSWVAHGNPTATIKTRAVDDSGNLETPSSGRLLNVGCTCSIFGTAMTPSQADSGSGTAVEVGVKFRSDVSGFVTGVRFYKASTNTGTHVGNLWTAAGSKLATATFSGETGSGWQQVIFAAPVQVNANATYVASYFAPAGHTAQDDGYMFPNPAPNPYTYSQLDSPPLHALRDSGSVTNGVSRNTATSAFPNTSTSARNFWVDVMFNPSAGPASVPSAPTSVTATAGDGLVKLNWTAPSDGGSPITSYRITPYVGTTAQTPVTVAGTAADTGATVDGLTNGTAYTFTVAATNAAGTGPASAQSNQVTPVALVCSPCTIWPSTAAPTLVDDNDPAAIELGVKFKADVNGQVTGIRFYKGASNTGTHVGSLWTTSGTKLASATFSGESASGWQQVTFATPVAVTAGTVYVASYFAPNGHYPGEDDFFAAAGVDRGPLHALADGVSGGNGVYRYASSSAFPSLTYRSENYWVDVMFTNSVATAPAAPAAPTATAGDGSAKVSWVAPADGGRPITSYTVTPYVGSTAGTPTTVTGTPPATTTTVTGLVNGTSYTFKVSATNSVGTGPVSAASSAVIPFAPTVPAAPGSVTATAGAGSATVSWSAPSNGGSAITSYTVTPYDGATAGAPVTVSGSPPAVTTKVSGLTNGTAYTFRVAATNAVGSGPDSAPSNSVTPSAGTVPGAPSGVSATPGDASASVTWTAPASGSSAITSYTVTPYSGTTAGTPVTVSGTPPVTAATVTGLTNGTAYTFTVSATSAVGTGAESSASGPVTPMPAPCAACTIWSPTATPVNADVADSSAVELGVKFDADVDGYIKGIRFYKGAGNTGTHVGNLWSGSGTQLAAATFTAESATGWQQVNFATPVAVTADTTYVASYFAPSGHYAGDGGYFSLGGVDAAPLHALANGVSGGNGVYAYGATSTFPSNSFNASNYWVDVVFSNSAASAPSAPTSVTATAGAGSATVTWTAPSNGGAAITSYTVTPYDGTIAQTPVTVNGRPPATTATVNGLTNGTAYTFKVSATNSVGTGPASAGSNSVTPTAATVPGTPTNVRAVAGAGAASVSWTAPPTGGSPITSYTVTPYAGTSAQPSTTVSGNPPDTNATITGLTNGTAYTFKVAATNSVGTGPESAASAAVTPQPVSCTSCTIWPATATPGNTDANDASSVELGVRFTSDVSGTITGVRFYKGTNNTGTHIGTLWSSTGTELASATFTDETASGWQQANFATPVAITAGKAYVASYFAPAGHYSVDANYFATAGVDNLPLHAPKDGASAPNGVFEYSSTSTFPNSTYRATNYWVDVVFSNVSASAPGAPTSVTATPGDASATVTWGVPSTGGSPITSYTVTPYLGTTAQTPTTVSGSPPSTTTIITSLTNGKAYTFTVSATNAVGAGPASMASNPVTPQSVVCTACTIWAATATPRTASTADNAAVEVGVKFKSDVKGFITGVRFYKGAGNSGTHVGSLWTNGGAKLASATFINESASGWQEVTFATPVAVSAGTVYVASYYAPVGRYSSDSSYFNAAGVDNPPLHALKNGVSGGNGVYRYGTTSSFPNTSFKSTNYWVDVVFSTS